MIVETERLIMRPMTRADLPWLVAMRAPEAVNRYLGGPDRQSAEALDKRLDFYIRCHDTFGFGTSAMILKETGEPIGTCGLQPLEDTGEIEVGYALAEEVWGRGLGFEAAYAWLKHGFENAGLERIVAVAAPANTGSWRIMEKCGMKYEKTDTYYESECVLYAISREEFLANQ